MCGSSPLMRGPLIQIADYTFLIRFIPAHAGTTLQSIDFNTLSTVHPRSCGDHFRNCVVRHCLIGSSPLMRGPPTQITMLVDSERFIPAHAGTTRIRYGSLWSCSVHPRSCGDHSIARSSSLTAYGSSPLMRGPLRCNI